MGWIIQFGCGPTATFARFPVISSDWSLWKLSHTKTKIKICVKPREILLYPNETRMVSWFPIFQSTTILQNNFLTKTWNLRFATLISKSVSCREIFLYLWDFHSNSILIRIHVEIATQNAKRWRFVSGLSSSPSQRCSVVAENRGSCNSIGELYSRFCTGM